MWSQTLFVKWFGVLGPLTDVTFFFLVLGEMLRSTDQMQSQVLIPVSLRDLCQVFVCVSDLALIYMGNVMIRSST